MKKFLLLATLTTLYHLPATASDPNAFPEGLRQRSIIIPTLNRYPVPNIHHSPEEEEIQPDCQENSFFGAIMSGLRSFSQALVPQLIPWPDLSDHDEDDQTISSLGTWSDIQVMGQGLASNGAPLMRKSNSAKADTTTSSPQQDPQKTSYDSNEAVELLFKEAKEEEAISKFTDVLRRHPEYGTDQILGLLDTPDKCEVAFDYLAKEKCPKTHIKGLNFERKNPVVLTEFIKYLSANKESFPNLMVMMCGGHGLNPAQTAQILSFMAAITIENAAALPNGSFVNLTPGEGVNTYLLVAIAARYTQRYPKLTVSISGPNLPAGFDGLELKPNLQLSRCLTYRNNKSDKHLKLMKQIIKEDELTLTYDGGKKLTLKN